MRLAEIDPINLYEIHKTFSLELASVLESQERVWERKVRHPHFWAHPPCPGLIRELGQETLGLSYATASLLRPWGWGWEHLETVYFKP